MTSQTDKQGPLSGLTVIDFGHYYAGPMAAMLLADQGATVIRVVKPGLRRAGAATPSQAGDWELPEPQYQVLNRNKKLLPLNLKTAEGKAAALSLIEKADVVIENFRPGVMQRLGLDYASVKASNPSLIYLSLPGFSSTDKARAGIQAWEGIMNAAAGSFTETHWWRQLAGYPPVYTWVPMCSAHGSMQGTIAVMAALVARAEHGQGTVIEAPLVTAAVYGFLMGFVSRSPETAAVQPSPEVPAFLQASAYSADDDEETQLKKLGLPNKTMMGPFARWYPCGDGRELMLWIQNRSAMARFLKALGIDKQLKQEGYLSEGPWVTGLDKNLDTLSPEHMNYVMELVGKALQAKSAEDWERELGDANIAVAAIRTRDEWLAFEPAHKAGLFTQMGDLTIPGQFADLTGPEGVTVNNSFASPEQITITEAEVLLGEKKPARASAVGVLRKGDLLSGLKVLDLTNLVAGPTATCNLAQYGAEVIKADPPRFIHPGLISSSMLEVNQGKRSILTDLTTAPGRDVFERLVRWADVVVHNSIDGVAERLGVTREQIQAINPEAVVCQFSYLGGILRGEGGWESHPGFDSLVQGVCGIMTHYGSFEHPQFHGQITCGDIMGGIGGTYAALLAVYQKRVHGVAGESRSSLARMINYMQLPGMISREGSSDWGEVKGQFTLGQDWYRRLYQCQDRWVYVEVPEARAAELAEVVTGQVVKGQVVTGESHADVAAMEAAFAARSSDYWLSRLSDANIACHLAANVSDMCAEGITPVDNGFADETAEGTVQVIVRNDHPAGRPIINLAPTWTRIGENQSYRRLTPALRYGQHTREILADIGYSAEEIDELIRLKVSHEFLPEMGSKEKYFFEPEAK